MGQNTSRARPRNHTPESAVSDATAAPGSQNESAGEPSSRTNKPSRRQSVRRSIMNLVSLRKSTSIHDQSPQPLLRRPPRRQWRLSRRWSSTTSSANTAVQEDHPSATSTSMSSHPHPPPPPPAPPPAPADSPPQVIHRKGKAKANPQPTQEERPPTPIISSAAVTDGATSSQVEQGVDHEEPTSSRIEREEQEEEVVISPTEEPSSADAGTQTIPPASDQAQTTTTPARPFPPPGTLVVVQGVVHTTDVARPQPAPAPVPSPAPSSRHRLSAFIPRPSSMLGTRPASYPGESSSATANALNTNLDTPPTDGETTPSTSTTDQSESGPTTANTTPGSDTPATANEFGSGNISPSSIDVLGTLLSVAAAATAASLLTGSSDPIFSSGLAPRTATATTTVANDAQPQAPLIPTSRTIPTSPPSLVSGLNIDPQAQARQGGRERMRHTWGALRERLGLRTPGGPGPVPGSPVASATGGGTRPMDARDVMLAEMARAFNVGLGLNTDGEGTGSNSDGEGEARGERQLPPENSFERFLIDLQADLRAALSAPEVGMEAEDDGAAAPAEPGASDIDPSVTAGESIPPASNLVPNAEATADSATTAPGESADGGADTSQQSVNEEIVETPTRDNAEFGDMPPLLESSDDEDEDLDMDEHSLSDHDTPLPNSTSVPRATADITPGSASRTERRPGGGINWWRLYRFPPISAPHAQGLSASLNGNGVTTSSAPAAAQVPSSMHTPGCPNSPAGTTSVSSATTPSDPSTSASMPPSSPTTLPNTPTTDSRTNAVVPVIVVGLQSVNLVGRRARPPPAPDSDAPIPTPNAESEDADNEDAMDVEGNPLAEAGNGNSEQGRGRRWQSRAANAFRNLRPGRRGSERNQTGDAAGSRTFLIYVIGGYYPPDHQIVTSGNALDSFEALWELAELLGQVKPPTATREDIENSGLEVFKPTVLEQYEKDGKVASNCIERCLICLDDYQTEDDLRLLSCRHAFHRSCVDKWLETGRNNCPACRSRGVPTDTAPPVPPAPIPTQRPTEAS